MIQFYQFDAESVKESSFRIARDGWPQLQLGRRDLFLFLPAMLLSIFSSLLTLSLRFYVLFHYCCSDAQVFANALVQEFYISYSHILNGTSSLCSATNDAKIWKKSAVRQISQLTDYTLLLECGLNKTIIEFPWKIVRKIFRIEFSSRRIVFSDPKPKGVRNNSI